MRRYNIIRTDGPPDWSAVPALAADQALWLPAGEIRMEARLCWDDRGLYVYQRASEAQVRAVHQGPLCQVCEDSCMEFFFCAAEGDERYFNFEINPNAAMYVGFGHGRPQRVRLHLKEEEKLLQKKARRLPDGWEVTYAIPLSLLRIFYPDYTLTPGRVLRANCYKCGDHTVQPHYLAWNPIQSPAPDFHRPGDFGEMVLE